MIRVNNKFTVSFPLVKTDNLFLACLCADAFPLPYRTPENRAWLDSFSKTVRLRDGSLFTWQDTPSQHFAVRFSFN